MHLSVSKFSRVNNKVVDSMSSELMMSDISRISRVNKKVALLLEALGSLLNMNGTLNND
jgi:hypothetical protein